jgi:NDP-sugar pyrophosphorylase family protein
VTDHYKNGKKIGAKIKYSIEPTKLGSAGAIKFAIENDVIKKSFINHYPDDMIVNYPNFPTDFVKVSLAAMKAGFECVVLCVPGKNYTFGVVEDDGKKVVDFVEKPFIRKDTNTAIYALSDKTFPFFTDIEPNQDVKIERSVLEQLAAQGKVFKVLMPTEYWIPVNDDLNLNKFVGHVAKKRREQK